MPNREFVAVMHAEHFIGVEPAAQAWMEVQRQIRSILNTEWDPIRVADSVEDEYDIYIARLYAMLQRDDSSENIAQHLLTLEGQMGGNANSIEHLREIADRLRHLELPRVADAAGARLDSGLPLRRAGSIVAALKRCIRWALRGSGAA